jgi:hypothetical protein
MAKLSFADFKFCGHLNQTQSKKVKKGEFVFSERARKLDKTFWNDLF